VVWAGSDWITGSKGWLTIADPSSICLAITFRLRGRLAAACERSCAWAFIKMDRQSSFMIHGRQLQCVLPPPLHPKRPFLFLFYKMKKKSSNPFYRLPLSTLNPSCPALTRKDFLPPQGLAINIKRSSSNTLTSDGYKSIMNTSLPAQP
jgi:hypothetical protein